MAGLGHCQRKRSRRAQHSRCWSRHGGRSIHLAIVGTVSRDMFARARNYSVLSATEARRDVLLSDYDLGLARRRLL
jgi:hypothetical protein